MLTVIEIHINFFYRNVYWELLLPSHAVMKEQMAFEWKMEIVVAADLLRAVRIIPVFPKCKVTAQSSLCVPFRNVRQWWYSLYTFLTLAPDGGEWSVSCHIHFTPSKISTRYLWVWGFLGHRVDQGTLKKREMFVPCQKSNDNPTSCTGHILLTILAKRYQVRSHSTTNKIQTFTIYLFL